jgi:TRAP-type C4-dicarboxylate transport system substrate-binding protein
VKKVKRTLAILLALIMVLSLAACGGGSEPAASDDGGEPAAEPITIKLQGAFPEGTSHYYYFDQFCESVFERSNGTLKVEWGSGPEAIPSDQLADAMVNNVVELVYSPCTYLVTIAPVLNGVKMTDPLEMRENGGVEYIDGLVQEHLNSHYLGRTAAESPYMFMSNKKIEKIEDFKGVIFRGTPAHRPFLQGSGAEMVTMGWGDVYQAVEKNVINGVGGTLKDFVDNSLGKVVDYVILPGIYNSDASLFVTNKTWDKLDDVQRQALIDSAIDWEADSAKQYAAENAEFLEALIEDGAEVNELTGDLLDQYLKIAYDSAWKVVEDADPTVAAEMRAFTDK